MVAFKKVGDSVHWSFLNSAVIFEIISHHSHSRSPCPSHAHTHTYTVSHLHFHYPFIYSIFSLVYVEDSAHFFWRFAFLVFHILLSFLSGGIRPHHCPLHT